MPKLAWDSKRTAARQEQRYVREQSASLYHTARWTRVSKAFRASHPLCAICASKGVIKAAQVTDHVTPWPVCGVEGFFDEGNLQALCEACNNEKGQRDKAVIAKWRRERKLSEG